jgi:hypothetical protein
MGDALKLWATETNKFYHCIETDLFAAIFPILSSIARSSRSVSILWSKYFSRISRIGAKAVKMYFYGKKKWAQREDQ